MAAAGSSRPCSGACHEISHAIDALYPDRATHGEQVAVGALFASFLREDGLVDEIEPAYSRLGIARLPGDLGLTDDEFAAAVAEAPSTRPDRYTILEHLALEEDVIRERVGSFVGAFAR
jgi:glycerol-1-phosphate dehydrogenase [NAD(P)+]